MFNCDDAMHHCASARISSASVTPSDLPTSHRKCTAWVRPWFETIDEMQRVLDDYLVTYNTRSELAPNSYPVL
ncbi:MAG: hypothetical protein RL693_213, partial [Verrucomicrobiota bacterium]